MSRLQDQDSRRMRLPSHGITVTDVKPSGLMAIKPTAGPVQKTKEGIYQNKKGAGCISISSVMVKAIKSALLEAADYNGPAELKRKTASAKNRPQTKNTPYAKCASASPTRAPNKKSVGLSTTSSNKKRGPGLLSKLELISHMNMEAATGTRSTPAVEFPTSKESNTQTVLKSTQKKKQVASPTRTTRSPSRKGQKDNSKRKSMVSVPAGSPDRKASGSKKPISLLQIDGFPVKATNQLPGCLETRNSLSSLSLDRLTFAKTRSKPRKQPIQPDMTTYEFMRKLMSYSSTSFRDLRNDRRTLKTPTLDSIPEES